MVKGNFNRPIQHALSAKGIKWKSHSPFRLQSGNQPIEEIFESSTGRRISFITNPNNKYRHHIITEQNFGEIASFGDSWDEYKQAKEKLKQVLQVKDLSEVKMVG
jgi:hypothetical protein